MNGGRQKSGRLQLVLIALVFLGPLLVAVWMYFHGGGLAPEGRSNHGALLEPIINIGDKLPGSIIEDIAGDTWLLIYASGGHCEESCREALYAQRQARLMLGREMGRITRVFLHGDSPPDTVFLAAEHAGLITTEDPGLVGLLNNKRPVELQQGGYYLVDPLGNLVMYFRPDLDPSDMVDDIRHLLRLSRIG